MTLIIDLPDTELERFQDAARRLGVEPGELARAAIVDLVERPNADFAKAAAYVLNKNRKLYERLR